MSKLISQFEETLKAKLQQKK